MEQIIKRLYYSSCDSDIKNMKEWGYYIKQIASTGNDNYVWVLFEKLNVNNDSL